MVERGGGGRKEKGRKIRKDRGWLAEIFMPRRSTSTSGLGGCVSMSVSVSGWLPVLAAAGVQCRIESRSLGCALQTRWDLQSRKRCVLVCVCDLASSASQSGLVTPNNTSPFLYVVKLPMPTPCHASQVPIAAQPHWRPGAYGA